MRRIKWSRAQWSIVGRVNNVSIFVVTWGISSNKTHPYVLQNQLPGMKDTRHASEEEAQNHAEVALVLFMESVGATFEGGN